MKKVNGHAYEDYQLVCMDVGYEICDPCPLKELCRNKPKEYNPEAYAEWKAQMNAIASEVIASGMEF